MLLCVPSGLAYARVQHAWRNGAVVVSGNTSCRCRSGAIVSCALPDQRLTPHCLPMLARFACCTGSPAHLEVSSSCMDAFVSGDMLAIFIVQQILFKLVGGPKKSAKIPEIPRVLCRCRPQPHTPYRQMRAPPPPETPQAQTQGTQHSSSRRTFTR